MNLRMGDKLLLQIVTVSLLLMALECSLVNYEWSYTERHHKEAVRMDKTGYARCSCYLEQKEQLLPNSPNLEYIYKTLHNRTICTNALSPQICSFFEDCDHCIATTESCEPVPGGYDCINSTILFQQLNRNTDRKNTNMLFQTYRNYDTGMGFSAFNKSEMFQDKQVMKKGPESKESSKIGLFEMKFQHGGEYSEEILNEAQQRVPKTVTPNKKKFIRKFHGEIFKTNFTKKSGTVNISLGRNKNNRVSTVLLEIETDEETPNISQPSTSVYEDNEASMNSSVPKEILKQTKGINQPSTSLYEDNEMSMNSSVPNEILQQTQIISQPSTSEYKDNEISMNSSVPNEVLKNAHKISQPTTSVYEDKEVSMNSSVPNEELKNTQRISQPSTSVEEYNEIGMNYSVQNEGLRQPQRISQSNTSPDENKKMDMNSSVPNAKLKQSQRISEHSASIDEDSYHWVVLNFSVLKEGLQQTQVISQPSASVNEDVDNEIMDYSAPNEESNRTQRISQPSAALDEDKVVGLNSVPNEVLKQKQRISKRSAFVEVKDEETGMKYLVKNKELKQSQKSSQNRDSVDEVIDNEIMDYPVPNEVLKQTQRISKRSAFGDEHGKIKVFEEASEKLFEQQESFEDNQGGAADSGEETEDPLNKFHEVHCEYPSYGRTYATEVRRFQRYDLVIQKCNYGYTFPEGIARTMRCDHQKNVLEPHFDIWTDECEPFLNCTVQFLRKGYAKCTTGLWFKPPTCKVLCEYYLEEDDFVDYHTCDVHSGWIPDLPSCAMPGSRNGLVLAPIPMLHDV